MKQKDIFFGLIFSVLLVFNNCTQQSDFPVLKGPYLGQKPPGMKPEIFAQGIVSTDQVELNAVFSPDGSKFYFTRKNPDGLYIIMFMEIVDGKWTKPQVAPFSGVYEEADPFFSPDGNMFFYISKKPEKGSGPPHDIFIMEKTETGWSEPYNPGPPLNTEYNEIYPSISANGVMYFNSDKPGGLGKRDIYRTQYVDGRFTEPENVGEPISSGHNEGDVFIAPDESYVIFTSVDRPYSYGSGDLYVCFKNDDDSWSSPVNMGEFVNTSGYDYCPFVTSDGKYFFFSKNNDLYWVDAKFIETLKPDDIY